MHHLELQAAEDIQHQQAESSFFVHPNEWDVHVGIEGQEQSGTNQQKLLKTYLGAQRM
jgi:hypothetical protein